MALFRHGADQGRYVHYPRMSILFGRSALGKPRLVAQMIKPGRYKTVGGYDVTVFGPVQFGGEWYYRGMFVNEVGISCTAFWDGDGDASDPRFKLILSAPPAPKNVIPLPVGPRVPDQPNYPFLRAMLVYDFDG